MALELGDKWLWDFWFAQDGEDYHLFYLQADRTLGDPNKRHWHVTVGHAVSRDLFNWTRLPDALAPSPPQPAEGGPEPADSLTTWTGSVMRESGVWYMFYTGTRRSERGLIQRICLATSSDLTHWSKHPNNPLLEICPRWYETLNTDYWHDQSWRDPWVFKDAEQDLYHMLMTCRVNRGAPDGRGAIGYARSADLIHWEAGEPLLAPGWYGEMEVPQVAMIQGRHYLFCSVSLRYHSREHLTGGIKPLTGLKYFPGAGPLGPFSREESGFLAADKQGSVYSGRVVQQPDGRWCVMAFRNIGNDGRFVGTLSDPMPIAVRPDGSLFLDIA